MTSINTERDKTRLYTEKDINFERVFEIRIRDIRERKGVKQRSFSIMVKKGIPDEDYISTDELKEIFENKTGDIQ